MVFFICNHCGESAKKASVEKHYLGKCRQFAKSLSCMDCLKDFYNQEFEAHTKCISEDQKYSGKDFVPKASQNSGEKKQECWTEIIRSILDSKEYDISKQTRSIFQRLQSYENVPRKQAKFLNFVGNSLRLKPQQVEEAWTILEKELESMKLAKQKEHGLSKVVAEQTETSDEKLPVGDCNIEKPESDTKKSESKKKKKKNRVVDEQEVTELCLAPENGLEESKVNVEAIIDTNSKTKKKSKKKKSGNEQHKETNGQEETQEPTDEPMSIGDFAANEKQTENDFITKNMEGEFKKDKSKKKKKTHDIHTNGYHQETTEISSKADKNSEDSKIAVTDGSKKKSKKRKSDQTPDEEQNETANNAEETQGSNEQKLKEINSDEADIIKSENGDGARDSKTKKKSKKRKSDQTPDEEQNETANNTEEKQDSNEKKLKEINSNEADIIKIENSVGATDSKKKKKSKKRKLEQSHGEGQHEKSTNEEETQQPTEKKLKKSNSSNTNGISKINQFDWHSAICSALKENGEKLKQNRLKDEVFKMYTAQLDLKSPSKNVVQKFKKRFFGSLAKCDQVRVKDGIVAIL